MQIRALILLLLASAFSASAAWEVSVPPAAVRALPVDADWRGYERIDVDVHCVDSDPPETIWCSLVLQTRQGEWFESRDRLALSTATQTFSLRLDDLSPDWLNKGGRRAYGRDVLRHVAAWGVKVGGRRAYRGRIVVNGPRLIASVPTPLELVGVELPSRAVIDRVNPVRCRFDGMVGNPYDSHRIRARLVCALGAARFTAPLYYRQEFVPTVHPGSGETRLLAAGRPGWQADWIPTKGGDYDLAVEFELGGESRAFPLGRVSASRGVSASPPGPVGQPGPEYIVERQGALLVRQHDGRWVRAAEQPSSVRAWRAQLDWTSAWQAYNGYGDFDQRTAWLLERDIRRQPSDEPLPLVVFSDDELDNQGVFNWIDHPLNQANGGPVDHPDKFFAYPVTRARVLDRCRYLLARCGGLAGVSGLLIDVGRAEPGAVVWINAIAEAVAAEFPQASIYCLNPELLERAERDPLASSGAWRTDARLSSRTELRELANGVLELRTTNADSAAIVLSGRMHLADAAGVAFDIETDGDLDDALAAMCFVRTGRGAVFESPMRRLRGGTRNRVVFQMDEATPWSVAGDSGRPLTSYERLSVRELGLRIFAAEPRDFALRVSDAVRLGPYQVDVETRPKLAIADLRGARSTVPAFGTFELAFQLNRVFRNPYDPREIAVDLELTDPKGSKLVHPGYFHETWELAMIDDRETPLKTGATSWRVRFTPSRDGRYAWRLTARAGGELAVVDGEFTCTPSAAPGFVRASPIDPRYFEFSDGSFFYPIGHNLRSPSDERAGTDPDRAAHGRRAEALGTRAYEGWFRKLAANGANYTRVWMSPWWCGLEWAGDHAGYHGVGYYNQANAARLDRILELAETNGVYLTLETINHGALSTLVDGQWELNPLRNGARDEGGFLRYATDFFSDPRAVASHRNKLRYTIARWGYSTAIAWWGVITEAEWAEPYTRSLQQFKEGDAPDDPWVPRPYMTPKHREAQLAWITATGGFIRKTDAHPHLVSVHFSNPQNGLEIWRRPYLDVVHNNAYTSFTRGVWKVKHFAQSSGVADIFYVFSTMYEPFRSAKPLLVGEWGGHPEANDDRHLTTELHTGLWALAMTQMSGATGYWWWILVDADDLYSRYRGVAAFMADEDRRGQGYRTDRARLAFDGFIASRGGLKRDGLVLYNASELMAYIYCAAINQHNSSRALAGYRDRTYPPSGEGELLLPADLANGEYRVEYWNTFTGEVVETRDVQITAEQRRVPVISHRVDVAMKVKRKAEGW